MGSRGARGSGGGAEALDGSSERRLLRRLGQAKGLVAGIDEAGRGPLAGPVVAAAVVLDLRRVPEGLADSKVLGPGRREALFEEILASAEVGIASASPSEIDAVNIRRATLNAMCRALLALPRRPRLALIDGRDVPENLACDGQAIVKGDGSIASIAAASIVAKVARDRLMARLDAQFPAYGFKRNAGYCTADHLRALAAAGPCPYHRMTFAPIAGVNLL